MTNKEMRECADLIAVRVLQVLPNKLNKFVRCTRINNSGINRLTRGRANFNGTFTLPCWLKYFPKKYFIYYVVHETIHSACCIGHDTKFFKLERKILAEFGLYVKAYAGPYPKNGAKSLLWQKQ